MKKMKKVHSLSYTEAYLKYFLFFSGIIENPAYKYVEYVISAIITINFCVFTFGMYITISFNELSLVEKAVIQQQLVAYAFSLVWHFTMKFNRDNLLKMKENFCNDDRSGKNDIANFERKIQLKTEKRFRAVAVFLTDIPVALYVLYIFPLYDIFMKLIGNVQSTHTSSFTKWYECGHADSGSFLNHFCWNVSNYKQFLVKHFVVSVLELCAVPAEHSSRVLLVLISINLNVRLTMYKKLLEKSFEKMKNSRNAPLSNVDRNVASHRSNLDGTSDPSCTNVAEKMRRRESYNPERALKVFIRHHQHHYR